MAEGVGIYPRLIPSYHRHAGHIMNKSGQHRLIVVSCPTISDEMYGIITTLLGRARCAFDAGFGSGRVGRIKPGTPCHEVYAPHLRHNVEEPLYYIPPCPWNPFPHDSKWGRQFELHSRYSVVLIRVILSV